MADAPNQGTRRVTQSSLTRGLVIQGNLDDTALPETIQFIQSLRKTGQLALERGETRQSAGISFVEGRVVHAYCPPLTGEICFHHLLTWRSGRYIFLPNAPANERTITCDTNALLLDGLRRLDELARCLERLPPRGTILYRRRDQRLLERTQLSFAHLRLWRRLDGQATVGAILDGEPDAAQLLVDLVAAGLAAPDPDHRFTARIVLGPTVRGAAQLDPQSRDLAARLLVACDGHRPLADAIDVLGCPPEDGIAAAEYLLALRLLQVRHGADAARLLA